MERNILVTGAAGFIGFHTCQKLIRNGFSVVGIDNLNSYYDQKLKLNRLKELEKLNQINNFRFIKIDLIDRKKLFSLFEAEKFYIVIHLAAQAGVRYSITNPEAYINSNLVGFNNLMEACRDFCKIRNFIFASSSSVYGGNTKTPFSEEDNVDHPVSLYAATKKANELCAHTYSHLYNIPCTGLRFFTVYGPWGRPDMAPFIFTKAILNKEPVPIFNHGNMARDFTYIDDISEILLRLLNKPATPNYHYKKEKPDPSISWAPYQIFNIGNSNKVNLMNFVQSIESELKIKAILDFQPMQKGDIRSSLADTKKIESYLNFKPNTPLELGIKKFINWYKNYYQL